MTHFFKEKINDPRLTTALRRTRSGRNQEFRFQGQSWHDEPFVSLKHDRPELYAELIDDEWYWVNGCGYCEDAHPSEKNKNYSYQLCDKHNVCGGCGQHRSVFKEAVWGRSDMPFCCNTCQQSEDRINRQNALSNTLKENPDMDDHHHWNEDSIVCPYCRAKIEDDEGSFSDPSRNYTEKCETCGEGFKICSDISITYTTTEIRPKEDVYREAGLLCDEECEEDESINEESENVAQSFTDALPSRDDIANSFNEETDNNGK